jgi:hypothetical protein
VKIQSIPLKLVSGMLAAQVEAEEVIFTFDSLLVSFEYELHSLGSTGIAPGQAFMQSCVAVQLLQFAAVLPG